MNGNHTEQDMDRAIEEKNFPLAEALTEELYRQLPAIDTAMPESFPADIMNKQKGHTTMKKTTIKILAAVAIIAVLCTSALAVQGWITRYYAVQDGALVETDANDPNLAVEITGMGEDGDTLDASEISLLPGKSFASVADAAKAAGSANFLPNGIDGYTESQVCGLYALKDSEYKNSKGFSALYSKAADEACGVAMDYFADPADYGDSDDGETKPETYTSKSGAQFSVYRYVGYAMTEGGDSDGDELELIGVTAAAGDGLLSLNFFGLTEEEIYAVLDQVVLP